MIRVDKSIDMPLYKQVYESVRRDILDGVWKPGEKIPSIRNMMSDLDVSRNTVVNACQQLYAEGYIESRHGAGYFVSDISFDVLRRPSANDTEPKRLEEPHEEPPRQYACDFSYGNLHPATFPMNTWRKLANEVLNDGNAFDMTSYGDYRGDARLRYEIARYLERSRGVTCSIDQIVLTSGVQQSVERLLKLFNPSSDGFAMEEPGFQGVRTVALDSGFRLETFPSDAPGDTWLDVLADKDFKIAYVTPANQMPMGTYQTLDERMRLLELTLKKDAYLLEDDYDSIYRFNMLPIPTLRSLDRWGRVIYMGTFSKVVSPALRIGYLVLPQELLAHYCARFERYRCTVPWLEQEVLRLFMQRGYLERHARRIELDVRSRHDALVTELKRQMPPEVSVIGSESGLHLLAHVRNGMNQEQLVAAAERNGVRVMGTRRYWNDPADAPDDLVMLGYASARKNEIPEGVRLLRETWFSA